MKGCDARSPDSMGMGWEFNCLCKCDAGDEDEGGCLVQVQALDLIDVYTLVVIYREITVLYHLPSEKAVL